MSNYEGSPSADSYYERLGVDPDASEETISTASKRAKRAVHPDTNSSDQATAETEFDRVTDAAATLTDPKSRAAYDTFLDEQGAATGTKRYEEWETAGRPRPPTEWLSESPQEEATPVERDATTVEADPRQGWTAADWNTTRREERSRDATAASETAETARSTTVDANTASTEATTSSADTTVDPNAAATTGSTSVDPNTTASSAETADTPSTPEATPNRAPPSVLGEDPEKLYSKYVLDSDAEWGHPDEPNQATDSQDTPTDTAAAWYVPSALDRLFRRLYPTPFGGVLLGAAPNSWLAISALVVGWLAGTALIGPGGELFALFVFVFVPKIGSWLYPTLAVVAVAAPTLSPLETGGGVIAGYAVVAVGYALLVRGTQLQSA